MSQPSSLENSLKLQPLFLCVRKYHPYVVPPCVCLHVRTLSVCPSLRTSMCELACAYSCSRLLFSCLYGLLGNKIIAIIKLASFRKSLYMDVFPHRRKLAQLWFGVCLCVCRWSSGAKNKNCVHVLYFSAHTLRWSSGENWEFCLAGLDAPPEEDRASDDWFKKVCGRRSS